MARRFIKRGTIKQGRNPSHPRSPKEAAARISRHLTISEDRATNIVEEASQVFMRDMVERAADRAPISLPETAKFWPGYLRASRYIYGPYKRKTGFKILVGFDAPYARVVHENPAGHDYKRGEDKFLQKEKDELVKSRYFWKLLWAAFR